MRKVSHCEKSVSLSCKQEKGVSLCCKQWERCLNVRKVSRCEKSVSLSCKQVHFFFNPEKTPQFPLLTEALKFYQHEDHMVRVAGVCVCVGGWVRACVRVRERVVCFGEPVNSISTKTMWCGLQVCECVCVCVYV